MFESPGFGVTVEDVFGTEKNVLSLYFNICSFTQVQKEKKN